MANEKNRSFRPLGEAELARVRGGVLYPAVKLLDTTVGMLTSDILIRFDGITGEAGGKDT